MVSVTEDDEGKEVVSWDGDDTLGRVVDVEQGTAYVDPEPDVTETLRLKLEWGDADGDAYPLSNETIARITDDSIYLRESL